MYAVRNIRLCTKDCLCLFVCPTGATDTETGQIDAGKCLDGCRRCVDACPSHAISLAMEGFPTRPAKDPLVAETLLTFMDKLYAEEKSALALAAALEGNKGALLARALARSTRIMAEDCAREAGFMIPQDEKSKQLLRSLLEDPPGLSKASFPEAAARELLEGLEKS